VLLFKTKDDRILRIQFPLLRPLFRVTFSQLRSAQLSESQFTPGPKFSLARLIREESVFTNT